mgnify:CR=1 FL=1
MVEVRIDERSLMASLASFFSEVNPEKTMGIKTRSNRADSNIAVLTRKFFETRKKHPFISYVEEMLREGANPYVLHDCA